MTKSRLDRTPNSDVREMEEIDLLELFRAILKYIKREMASTTVVILN